jgi:hypothetical protein
MNRTFLSTDVFADPSWWHWALTIPLLAAHLLSVPRAIETAIVLCAVMTLYYFIRLRSLHPFPVQVRVAYLGWLLIGLLPNMHWMFYIAFVGLIARVLFGYCLLGRLLNLAGFNRNDPLTFSLIFRVFLSRPDGGLFQWRATQGTTPLHSCTLRRKEARL